MNDDPSPFAVLGVPETWRPTPVKYTMGKVTASTPTGMIVYHTLCVDGPMGRTALTFQRAELRDFIAMLTEALTGLAVASDLPANGHVTP